MAGSGTGAPITAGVGGTAELIARVRDLMAEETADLYGDATELLPALNEGKDIIFSTIDVLPKTLTQLITGAVASYAVADLGRIDWIRYGTTGHDLVPIHADEIRHTLGTSGTPQYYAIGLSNAGVPQITLYPTPGATDTTTLVGSYFAVPADLTITGSNPTWHHFLPCYHAAAVMLRKDRRPEASTEMEGRFRSGIVEYGKWYASRFPYRGDTVRSQPSPMGTSYTPTYPDEIG
jgi:hypothetical protein